MKALSQIVEKVYARLKFRATDKQTGRQTVQKTIGMSPIFDLEGI